MRKQGNAVIFDLEGKLGLGPAVDAFRAQWTPWPRAPVTWW